MTENEYVGVTKLKTKLLFLLIVLLLCACRAPTPEAAPSPESKYESESSVTESFAAEGEAGKNPMEEKNINYVRSKADMLLDTLIEPQMDDNEKILTAYRYMVENVYFAEPVGYDMWYYRGGQTSPPDFTELRALSPIVFGIGSCEDFACAMVVLLEQMGYEAMYVPGYTVSVDGDYVDHAWAIVRLGKNWYHLDPQLEQNIARQNIIRYRYFLKSDDDMIYDHKWGENLISFWRGISVEDAQRIRDLYTPPICAQSMSQLSEDQIELPARPDVASLLKKLQDEKEASGLTPIEAPDISPPVLIHENID